MNRRAFLSAVAASIPAMALDPERLLWIPGQRSYFDTFGAPYVGETIRIRLPQRFILRAGEQLTIPVIEPTWMSLPLGDATPLATLDLPWDMRVGLVNDFIAESAIRGVVTPMPVVEPEYGCREYWRRRMDAYAVRSRERYGTDH